MTRVADFGVFVELEPGVEGLIPLSETGIARGGDVKKGFPAGTSLDVVVLEVDAATRRIRLSATAVQKLREADEVREYTERGGYRAGRNVRIARRQTARRAQSSRRVSGAYSQRSATIGSRGGLARGLPVPATALATSRGGPSTSRSRCR